MAEKPLDELERRRLFQTDAAFFGKITAGVSHEINNVLTIINEYSGLLGDLLHLANERKTQVEPERIQKITTDIGVQIQRGKGIVKNINKFAHSVDEPVSTFNVVELLADIVELTRHFARTKRVLIELDPMEEEILLVSDPFKLQHGIFLALHMMVEGGSGNGTIRISCHKDAKVVVVNLASCSIENSKEVELQKKRLAAIMRNLGGSFEDNPGDEGCAVKLSVPGISNGRI